MQQRAGIRHCVGAWKVISYGSWTRFVDFRTRSELKSLGAVEAANAPSSSLVPDPSSQTQVARSVGCQVLTVAPFWGEFAPRMVPQSS